MKEEAPRLGVIGGSGLYEMPGLEAVEEIQMNTPFGAPSGPIVVGFLSGRRIAFLARHGEGHPISPTEVNYRANIYALKSLGIERVVAICAAGSLREDYAPGHIVVPDQLVDFTKDRQRTFFEEGLVAHISVADPFCPDLSQLVFNSLQETPATVHRGGSLVTIEGPRFSTRAESNIFRSWGISLIGMTTSPEAFLAKEAELCYAVIAHVTDYDVWHVSEEPVTAEMVMRNLIQNTRNIQLALNGLVPAIDTDRICDCPQALASAITTRPEAIPAATRQKLSLLVDKYLS